MDLPIACTLTTAKLHERRQEIMNTFRRIQIITSELEAGYAFAMPASSEVLHRLTDLVDMERQCCAFLTFKIVIAKDAMKLEVTGPSEAKKLIAEYFTL